MSVLVLSILCTVAWSLWAVAGAAALRADKLEQKRPPDAGFSVVPVIPLFPIVAVVLAVFIDEHAAPWGTRTVGGIHALLALTFLACIARELRRIRSASRPTE
jgi:hypothetical protein